MALSVWFGCNTIHSVSGMFVQGLQVLNPRTILELKTLRSSPLSVEAPLGPVSTINPIDDLLVFVIAIENLAVGRAAFAAPGAIICRLAARMANDTPATV